MNQFSNLSAESEVSALARVDVSEVFTDETANIPAPRPLNTAKLVRHNLRNPFAQRIDRADLAARVAFARTRGNIMALWAQIHAECEPARAALRAREAALDALC